MNVKEIESDFLESVQQMQILDRWVNDLVKSYIAPVTEVVDFVKQRKNTMTDVELVNASVQLSAALYAANAHLERIGLHTDLTNQMRKLKYNEQLVAVTGKVVDKQSLAELACQKETLLCSVVERAYKTLKACVESGTEVLQSIKKVLSLRIQELSI